MLWIYGLLSRVVTTNERWDEMRNEIFKLQGEIENTGANLAL